jgi:hypothetical protein
MLKGEIITRHYVVKENHCMKNQGTQGLFSVAVESIVSNSLTTLFWSEHWGQGEQFVAR